MAAILRKAGYPVLAAADGASTLEVAATYPGPIGLLITDVAMPAMPGPELANRFAPVRPDSRVLFISGFADSTARAAIKKQPQAEYLHKPFSAGELLRRVQAMVG